MRKLFWRLHSIIGLISGLALLVIGLTGTILVFHEEIDAVVRPEQTRVEPLPEGRLPLSELLRKTEQALPGYAVTGWALNRQDPEAADGVFVIPFGEFVWHYTTVDPYRGIVLDHPEENATTFKSWILDLHYTLLLGPVGMALSGVLGVLLCFLGISGLWIYRRFWKHIFRLQWRKSARIFFGSFHRMVGVMSVLFNLLLGFTGAYWNIEHAIEELFLHAHHAEEVPFEGRLYDPGLPLDSLLTDATRQLDGFETHYISLPWAVNGPITLWGRSEDAPFFRSRYGSQVVYDPQTLAFTSANDLRHASLWAQVLDAFEPLHFGDFGGLPIQILWALAGLAPGLLAISGTAIWWQRRRHTPARPQSGRPAT